MRLLILVNNPERAGFRQRVAEYLPAMQEGGIDAEVARIPEGLLARRQLFAQAAEFDGVLVHKKGLNIIDAHLLRRGARRLIYNYDDAVMYSDKRPEKDSRSHFAPWRRMVRMADAVIVGSEYLAELGREYNQHVHVVPLGLRVGEYACATAKADDGRVRLVWIGSTGTLDYLGMLKPALEAIGAKRKDVVLRQICETFIDMDAMPVEKLQWQREKRGEYLGTADIGLAPLPRDRFTMGKCSFKVLEYSAAGLPVVASPVGTNAEHVKDGVTGFLADSPEKWQEHLMRLIDDEGLRRRMGEAGRQRAAEFDVSVVGPRLVSIIRQALER